MTCNVMNCCMLWIRCPSHGVEVDNNILEPKFLTPNYIFLFSFSFFFQKIFFISIKKSARGLQNVHKKVLYTKEMVKAGTMGDDISISVLDRKL